MPNEFNDWIKLRYIVISLGEFHNWWPTKIISGKGEEFLEYVLPNTKSSAAYQLATEICRLEHDKNIGPGKYHVFRLPQKWEEEIFNDRKSHQENVKILLQDKLMTELLELSSGISVSSAKGPLMVGSHDELHDLSVFQSIAKHYYEAFKNNYKTYPYLN